MTQRGTKGTVLFVPLLQNLGILSQGHKKNRPFCAPAHLGSLVGGGSFAVNTKEH